MALLLKQSRKSGKFGPGLGFKVKCKEGTECILMSEAARTVFMMTVRHGS